MTSPDAVTWILDSLHQALARIPAMAEEMSSREFCGDSANGSVRVFFSAVGEFRRVEIEPDFYRSAGTQRLEAALLESFGKAESAAAAAREEFGADLVFMGIPIASALRGGSIIDLLPPPSRISEVLDGHWNGRS